MSTYTYRCAPTATAPTSQAAAAELLGKLTGLLMADLGPGGAMMGVDLVAIADGSPTSLLFSLPPGGPVARTAPEAMRRAWEWMWSERIEPPNLALGNVVSATELALAGWAITHYLPVGVADAVRAVLAAAGLTVPGSAAGAVAGIVGAMMTLHTDVPDDLIALGDALKTAGTELKAKPGATADDAVQIAEDALAAAAVDVGVPQSAIDEGKAVAGILAPLIVHLLQKKAAAAAPAKS